MMTDALTLWMAIRALAGARARNETKLPEPEFKPFRFPKHETAARAGELTPANVAREPRTLEELGVPGPLAREMEATFQVMGLTRGERVTGFTFIARDGTRHALRLSDTPSRGAAEKAA